MVILHKLTSGLLCPFVSEGKQISTKSHKKNKNKLAFYESRHFGGKSRNLGNKAHTVCKVCLAKN